VHRLAGDALEPAGKLEDSSKVSYALIGSAIVLLIAFTFIARHLLAKRFKAA